jgi:hypothetical protein
MAIVPRHNSSRKGIKANASDETVLAEMAHVISLALKRRRFRANP